VQVELLLFFSNKELKSSYMQFISICLLRMLPFIISVIQNGEIILNCQVAKYSCGWLREEKHLIWSL
jgi:hypothetical protein